MSKYKISGGFTDSQDNQSDFTNKYSVSDSGPYIAVVKNTTDPLRMGRLGVIIPALAKTDGLKASAEQITWCQYLSPFYGATPFRALGNQPYNGPQQKSYGMWAIPPDVDTNVLVIFAKGEKGQNTAFWIGCVQEPLTNQMVPGFGSSTKTAKPAEVAEGAETTKLDTYGTDVLPATEKNKNVYGDAEEIENLSNWKHPINQELTDQLMVQGLITDPVRGTTTSSARRDTPSGVFGFNTPGPVAADSRILNIGVGGTAVAVDRSLGQSFVMDDGDENGINQQIRLRSASGHQLLLNDTQKVIYLSNGSGNSWIEMSEEGKISIYAKDGFNLRADGNFDLHSGGDINFHAKENIKFTAEKEITTNAEVSNNIIGGNYVFVSSPEGIVQTWATQGISSSTGGTQRHGASGNIDLAGSQVHLNSTGNDPSWGPNWLNANAAGIFTDDSQNDVNINVGASALLEANTKATKTTVPRLVTHEPYTRAPSATIENVSQWQNEAEWRKLSQTPGTLEYMAQQNRLSTSEYQRHLQYVADTKKYINDFEKKPIITVKNVNVALQDWKNLSNQIKSKNIKLSTKQINILRQSGIYDAREARIAGQSIEENVKGNASAIVSKMNRYVKDFEGLDFNKKNINLDTAKKLSDTFTSNYNKLYNVKTVVNNLNKDNLQQILVQNVVGGNITSVATKIADTFFYKGGSGVPDMISGGGFSGGFSQGVTQVAKSFKSGISRAIGKFTSLFG